MKLLLLGTYDAILGMDLLEANSPMKVNWHAKLIKITTPDGVASLRGHEAHSTSSLQINAVQLQNLCKTWAISHMVYVCMTPSDTDSEGTLPTCIQQVLEEFSKVFGKPTGLPPRRSCDQKIPLIPGAQPINVRPHHYKPDQKDEIEAQVAELLRQGIIQKSSRSFSSPVILVEKKDDVVGNMP